MAQRQANADAKDAGRALPYPNPWDALMQKLPPGASLEERRRWCADLYDRCAP
jgi:hypothetical protein